MRSRAALRTCSLALALAATLPAAAEELPAPDRADELDRIDDAIAEQVNRRRLGGMAIFIGGLAAVGGAIYDAGKFDESGWAALGGAIGLACGIGGATMIQEASVRLGELRQQRLELSLAPAAQRLAVTFRFGAP